jgi:hypothetical protein
MSDAIALRVGAGLLLFAGLAALVWPRAEEARALREVAALVAPDALVVVDDVYAEHVGAMLDEPAPVFMIQRDLDRHARALPCAGPVYWLTQHADRRPRALGPLPVVGEREVVGAKLVELQRR